MQEKCLYGTCCADSQPPCDTCGFYSDISKGQNPGYDRFVLASAHYILSPEDALAQGFVEGPRDDKGSTEAALGLVD